MVSDMNIPEPLGTHLVKCVGCTVSCSGVQLDSGQGIIPRGFGFGSGTIPDKELMVIFPEPASNDYQEQMRYCRAKDQGGWESVVDEVDRVTTEYFKTGRTPFHRRTRDLLGEVFKTQEEIFRRCYFTELTKCQKLRASIPSQTREDCLELYLRKELEIVQPKAALLFGVAKNYQGTIDSIMKIKGRTILAQHPSARPPDWLYGSFPERKRITGELRCLLQPSRLDDHAAVPRPDPKKNSRSTSR